MRYWKSFTKKFPNLQLWGLKSKDIFHIQRDLNIPEKVSQYLNIIIEHLISNKKLSTSIDMEFIRGKIYDYIMNKIYHKIFPAYKEEKDEKIENKCRLLEWTKPIHFVKDKYFYTFDCFLKDSIFYFRKINQEKSPMKKILAIKEIFNSIS